MVLIQRVMIGVTFLVFAALLAVPWGGQDERNLVDAVNSLGGQWVDRQAPSFSLPDRIGQTRTLNDYRGQVIFLNFWASFCEPCRREMPSMENLVRQYTGQGMVMLAISLDVEMADAEGFMREFLPGQHSAMTVLLDSEQETARAFGTELIPETYIIDRTGRIVARFVGEYDWTRPEVKHIIEELL